MFKKIIDNSHCTIRSQFLQSFGIECLSKIKNIERKFNQVEWESEKCSFEIIAFKVRTMLDCYQLITHQIYDSLESGQLESLGHSIVKMFLQISSAIKWLIKSFSVSFSKGVKQPEQIEEVSHRQSESEKFRKRQISRFILKGVLQNMDSDCDQDVQGQNSIQNFFGRNKQNFTNSKNKILSINSSNLPLILEDTVDYLTKKSEYIEKFVALRENYEGSNWFQQALTSQAIMEFDFAQKNSESTSKFKDLMNKILSHQHVKKSITQEIGIQVTPAISAGDKLKKAAEKQKLKLLSDQIEKQKNLNKDLKQKLELYEKRIENYRNESHQFEVSNRKQMSLNKTNRKRLQRSQVKAMENQNLQERQHLNEIQQMADGQNIQPQQFGSIQIYRKSPQKSFRLLKSKSYKKDLSSSVQEVIEKEEALRREAILNFNSKIFQISLHYDLKPISEVKKEEKKLKFDSFVFHVEILAENRNSGVNRQSLMQILQFEQASKKFIYGKIAPISPDHVASCTNSPICRMDEKFPSELKNLKGKQNLGSFREHKVLNWRNHKIQSHGKSGKVNFNVQNLLLESLNRNQNSRGKMDFESKFKKLYRFSLIKSVQIDEIVLRNFFIDQSNAKNYELLNLSEICNPQKKIKSSSKSSKAIMKSNISNSNFQIQGMLQFIVVKYIYGQMIKTKIKSKEVYLKLILFLRYPFSSFYRSIQIQSKLDQAEGKSFSFEDLQYHFKRIWVLHSRCSASSAELSHAGWCYHKEFILDFFGLKKQQNSQND